MLHAIQAMPREQCYLSTHFALKIQQLQISDYTKDKESKQVSQGGRGEESVCK